MEIRSKDGHDAICRDLLAKVLLRARKKTDVIDILIGYPKWQSARKQH